MNSLRRLARRLGYDLTPVRKARPLAAQRTALLDSYGIACVLDVGANTGQYAAGLREWGYRGRIVSFEPLAAAHAALERRAARDPLWTVAPRMALGERDGLAEIEVSAESDMSSLLPQTDLLRRVSPTSGVIGRETISLHRLDTLFDATVGAAERSYLKIDTQGSEPRVLGGARGVLDRIVGIELEMSLVPCYEGERDFREIMDALADDGFVLHLLLPGYFERKLGRQLQVDGVFYRADAAASPPTG